MAGVETNENHIDFVQEDIPDGFINEEEPTDAAHVDAPEDLVVEEEPAVQFTEEDLKEARERAELSLLARIFWDEPRELRVVENSFIQPLPSVPPPNARGRGGLPPSVAARLSSNLQRQWTRDRQMGGARGHARRGSGGPRPFLGLPGPGPLSNLGPGRLPRGPGQHGHRPQVVQPLRIMDPDHAAPGGQPMNWATSQARGGVAHLQSLSEASFVSEGHGLGRQADSSSRPLAQAQRKSGSLQIRPLYLGQASSSGPTGPARASSTPIPQTKHPVVPVACSSAPVIKTQVTPQSKLNIGPAPAPSRRSTPSSGSVKRKLLAAFESADGSASPQSAELNLLENSAKILYGLSAAAGPWMGLRCQISTSLQILAFQDNWIPTAPSRPPERIPSEFPWSPYTPVSMFINHGYWDLQLLTRMFSAVDVDRISGIPLPIERIPDQFIWQFSDSEAYTVHSGYDIVHHGLVEVSEVGLVSPMDYDAWNKLWSFPVPPKL
ncbi:hypothetical protein LINPERHAP2_LOCUS2463 [Linum perenne]